MSYKLLALLCIACCLDQEATSPGGICSCYSPQVWKGGEKKINFVKKKKSTPSRMAFSVHLTVLDHLLLGCEHRNILYVHLQSLLSKFRRSGILRKQ